MCEEAMRVSMLDNQELVCTFLSPEITNNLKAMRLTQRGDQTGSQLPSIKFLEYLGASIF